MRHLNKKAQMFKYILGAIFLVIFLVIGLSLAGRTNNIVSEPNRCAKVYCTFENESCGMFGNEQTIPSGLKCESKKMKCCVPPSDPLAKEAKALEKIETVVPNAAPVQSQPIMKPDRIIITMNDDLQQLGSTSARNLIIGTTSTIHIIAEGENAKNCTIQLIDGTGIKVETATWLKEATFGTGLDCSTQKNVVILPNDWNLHNQKYTLQVVLRDNAGSITTQSTVQLIFIAQ